MVNYPTNNLKIKNRSFYSEKKEGGREGERKKQGGKRTQMGGPGKGGGRQRGKEKGGGPGKEGGREGDREGVREDTHGLYVSVFTGKVNEKWPEIISEAEI